MHVVAESKKPFVPSIDREKLRAALLVVAVDDVITHAALSEAIGRDVLECRWILESARRGARDSGGAVFEPVVGVGLRRITNEEKPGRGPRSIAKARRAIVRGVKDVKTTDYSALTDAGKVTFNMTLSVSGALMLMARPSKMKALPVAEKKYDPAETMRLLLGKKK